VPSPETVRARELRRDMSHTEWRVWYNLRGKQLAGHRFRRQHPVGPYFVDFVCLKSRLAIEIDGDGHDDEERDRRKTEYLKAQGFRVIRIDASETDQNMDGVLQYIWAVLEGETSPP
jgi:very-short-patch-repair endonuclease